jgi:triacylglycerol lipase
MVIASLSHRYPELERVINRHATEEGRSLLASAEKMTTILAVIRLMNKDIDHFIDRPLDEILAEPEVQYVFDDIKLGTAAPSRPVLVVQAVHDKIVSVDDIDALIETYRAGGAAVTYHRDMLSEHMLLHPMSAPMTLRWLRDRFAGRPLTDHLQRTAWPTLLNPSTYKGIARLLSIAAKVATGRKVERQPLSVLDEVD